MTTKAQHTPGPFSYEAAFSNGVTRRINKGRREYRAAWCFTAIGGWEGASERTVTGFARDRETAAKAIATESRFWMKANDKPRYAGDKVWPAGKMLFSEIIDVQPIAKAEGK